MRERIDIIVPDGELYLNGEKKNRLEKTCRFEPVDRIPVISRGGQWAALYGRRATFGDYIRSARDNMRSQILNYKWYAEYVPGDAPIVTDKLFVEPDFGALRGIEFPMEIVWQENQPAKCIHPLTEPEQIDTLEIPDPAGGLNAKKIQWYKEMLACREDFDVRINGEHIALDVTVRPHGGPLPAAFALAGENLFIWMLEEPELVHKLMDVVTNSFINCIEFFDELTGRNCGHSQHMGADTAEMLSPRSFREFVVPYYLRVWEKYKGPRSFHMCGKIDHLLDIILHEMGVTYFDCLGFPVDYKIFGEKFAGRMIFEGGPSPMLIHDGPVDNIIRVSEDYIKTLGGKGGYILNAGGDAVPGTPGENLAAMVEASKRVGYPAA